MPPVFVPFTGWSPGGSEFGEGWKLTYNLYPSYGDWRPWRKFVSPGGSVAFGPVTGAYPHVWMSGGGTSSYAPDAATLFAGTKTRLFTVNPSTGAFTDVSRAANYGAAGEPSGWRFVSVGNDIWATNWTDPLQRRTNNAGLFANGVVSTFTPQPRFLAVVREHLLGANLSNAGRFQDEVVWSDADNATNFDPPTGASTSIAGGKRLISVPGQITGLIGGQYGLAFKRTAIYYLEYAGPPAIFRPELLSSHVGTAYPGSIINSRHGVFFLGPDGFYQVQGLSSPVKISPPGLEQDLFESTFSVSPTTFTAAQEDTMMTGFQIPGMPLVGWAYRSLWTDPTNPHAFFFNPVSGLWSQGQVEPELSALISRPLGTNLYDTLGGFTYSAGSGSSTYAAVGSNLPWGQNMQAVTLELRFRPANFEKTLHQQQSLISGVLPMFSKLGAQFTPPAIEPGVMIEAGLDPHSNALTAYETRAFSERDTISGFLPFQIAGRFFKIRVGCAAADFANFEGVWIDQRVLS